MREHCYVAGREGWGECSGRLDAAHLIPKQRIRRELKGKPDLLKIIWDPRVIVPLCRFHHGQLDNRRRYLTREELPHAVELFAREHGLGWSLERDYR